MQAFFKNYKHLNLLQNRNDTENDFLNVFFWNPEYMPADDWNVWKDFWGLFPVWPVQIILHFCDNIFYTITYCIYRPLGSQLRKSIIAARHMLTIKFASIYSDAYGLSTFELLPFLSWRVLFNLFSYSFTLCSLPVTPFSRFIFIAIYYPSKKKKRK